MMDDRYYFITDYLFMPNNNKNSKAGWWRWPALSASSAQWEEVKARHDGESRPYADILVVCSSRRSKLGKKVTTT